MPIVKICNCGHNEFAHAGLPLPSGYEPKCCTFSNCGCDEFTAIKLTHAELCKLGQIFHASANVDTRQWSDARIAEWLKDRLAEVGPPQQNPSALTPELLAQWQVESGSVQAIRKEGTVRY